ncbi:MAG: fibrobacter succinogenes major paralogous domain-containing protein [Bacteroidetes bacterium]|nr:fibrobacter succinogenes major paralogous domain-containing protein [Bacteroidota bacterium]
MKTVLFTISFLLITSSVFGQTKMVIHKTDGQKDTLATTEIPKITFIMAETVTDFDGNIYHTVQIGNQLRTVENLRTTKYNDGTDITKITTDNTGWTTTTSGAYCAYNNDEINVNSYGYLYNWHAVNTGKLAPAGWRVPTDDDWTILENEVGGSATAGIKLKATLGWNGGGNGTDDYGFSALPGGYRNYNDGLFRYHGYNGCWWSSTVNGENWAWGRGMVYINAGVDRSYGHQWDGFSVRLVRDL